MFCTELQWIVEWPWLLSAAAPLAAVVAFSPASASVSEPSPHQQSKEVAASCRKITQYTTHASIVNLNTGLHFLPGKALSTVGEMINFNCICIH